MPFSDPKNPSKSVQDETLRPTLSAMMRIDIIMLNLLGEIAGAKKLEAIRAIEAEIRTAKNPIYEKTMWLYLDLLKNADYRTTRPAPIQE